MTTPSCQTHYCLAGCNNDSAMADDIGCKPHQIVVWFVAWVDMPPAILKRRMQESALRVEEETQRMTDDRIYEFLPRWVNTVSAGLCCSLQHCSPTTNKTAKKSWDYEHLCERLSAAIAPPVW